jgi:hypothetical protein
MSIPAAAETSSETDSPGTYLSANGDPVDQVLVHLFSGHLLRTAMILQLPDAVDDESTSVDELAGRIQAHPGTLRRLLRALSGIGVFRSVGDDAYAQTPVSRVLRSSELGNLFGAYATTECLLRAWDSLANSVRTGVSPFRELYGTDFYTYLGKNDPEKSARRSTLR